MNFFTLELYVTKTNCALHSSNCQSHVKIFLVVTHFKGNVSVVFQVVLGEYNIRVKGAREVNDPKKEEKKLIRT